LEEEITEADFDGIVAEFGAPAVLQLVKRSPKRFTVLLLGDGTGKD